MLDLSQDVELPAVALDSQFALLSRRSSESGPNLSHARIANRNAIDRYEMIPLLHAIRTRWHRCFPIQLSDA